MEECTSGLQWFILQISHVSTHKRKEAEIQFSWSIWAQMHAKPFGQCKLNLQLSLPKSIPGACITDFSIRSTAPAGSWTGKRCCSNAFPTVVLLGHTHLDKSLHGTSPMLPLLQLQTVCCRLLSAGSMLRTQHAFLISHPKTVAHWQHFQQATASDYQPVARSIACLQLHKASLLSNSSSPYLVLYIDYNELLETYAGGMVEQSCKWNRIQGERTYKRYMQRSGVLRQK